MIRSIKIMLEIARAELRTLFYSPIAWLLLIIFFLQCSDIYTYTITYFSHLQYDNLYQPALHRLTAGAFGPIMGLFYRIISKLYLYIPLLTMGLMSRETSSGTIKLLHSSPVKLNQIVFGKFLAMVGYCLLLMAVLIFFAVAGILHIKSADAGLLLSGLLGIFLLLCTYSAIGLFMSCLTSYQVVAAISTLAVFAFLEYVGSFWQGVNLLRDITDFLSISGRTENMLFGLITTKDVLYFLIIIAIFLILSIIKLQAERKPVGVGHLIVRVLLVITPGILSGYIFSRPGFIGYLDTTVTKNMTVTRNTQQMLAEMKKGTLELTYYVNLLDEAFFLGAPNAENNRMEQWGRYMRFKPDINFRYIYYYDTSRISRDLMKTMTLEEVAKKRAKGERVDLKQFLTPGQIRQMIDLQPEQNRCVVQARYNGRTTFLRQYDDQERVPGEEEVDAALKRLLIQPPKIGFLQGAFERSINRGGDRDYELFINDITFRKSLVNQGFDVCTISGDTSLIPADVSILVIADPRVALSEKAVRNIEQYIQRGGNLLIAGEPGKQEILNPVIKPLGIQLNNGQLVQETANAAPDAINQSLEEPVLRLSSGLKEYVGHQSKVFMNGTASLSCSKGGEFDIWPLLKTNADISWNMTKPFDRDSGNLTFRPSAGDQKGQFTTVAALTRRINKKEQRIIVSGDADFLAGGQLLKPGAANLAFSTAVFEWLTYGALPVNLFRPDPPDNKLKIAESALPKFKFLCLFFIPAVLLVAGGTYLIRRKMK
jgi:ABC-2 type transport system permease protein